MFCSALILQLLSERLQLVPLHQLAIAEVTGVEVISQSAAVIYFAFFVQKI